jgi:hypothetical protein
MAFPTALSIITNASALTNLTFVIDVGDSASVVSSSAQSIIDPSGGSPNGFRRGSSTGVGSDDPTFNGTAGGLSSAEYYSFDGSDTIQAVSNPLQTWHKDNAILTFMGIFYITQNGSGVPGLMSDQTTSSTDLGFRIIVSATGHLQFSVANGTTNTTVYVSSFTVPASQWVFLALSYDEASGNGFMSLNGVYETFTQTYTSPSATSATSLLIGRGLTTQPLLASSRIGWVAAWTGTALSQATVTAIYREAAQRFAILFNGVIAQTITSMSQAATGLERFVSAVSQISIPSVQSISAQERLIGSTVQTIIPVNQNAIAKERFVGSGGNVTQATLPLSQSAVGKERFVGATSQVIIHVGQSINGKERLIGSASQTIIHVGQSASSLERFLATVSQIFNHNSQNASGLERFKGVVTQSAIHALQNALVSNEITASVVSKISPVIQGSSGKERFLAAVIQRLNNFSQSVVAFLTIQVPTDPERTIILGFETRQYVVPELLQSQTLDAIIRIVVLSEI